MPQGIIVKGIGGFYYVKYNTSIIECKVRGIFRKQQVIPIVGDRVDFELNDDKSGVITNILDRKNSMIRPPVANIDQVVLVFSITQPSPDFLLIDKLIALLEYKNIEIAICINKIDLSSKKEYKKISDLYKKIGYPVVCTSAKKKIGINQLKKILKGKVSTLAGSSGVGKSSLLNIILKDVQLKTGEISKKIERGKHTTKHVELFELEEGGFILDTPGFSVLNLNEIKSEDLKYYFREFEKYCTNCKFTGCNHINEPGCAVKEAVENNQIDSGRYNRYKIIFNELKLNKEY